MNRKLYAGKEVLKEAVRMLGIAVAITSGIIDAFDRAERLLQKREIDSTRNYDDQYNKQLEHYNDCIRALNDYQGRTG